MPTFASGLLCVSGNSAKSGSGSTVVMQSSPTITTPTIGSFTNATHTHQNAAGGGTLDAAAIAAGQQRSWSERRDQRLAAIRTQENRAKISEKMLLHHTLQRIGGNDIDAVRQRIAARAEKWHKPKQINLDGLQRLLCGHWP